MVQCTFGSTQDFTSSKRLRTVSPCLCVTCSCRAQFLFLCHHWKLKRKHTTCTWETSGALCFYPDVKTTLVRVACWFARSSSVIRSQHPSENLQPCSYAAAVAMETVPGGYGQQAQCRGTLYSSCELINRFNWKWDVWLTVKTLWSLWVTADAASVSVRCYLVFFSLCNLLLTCVFGFYMNYAPSVWLKMTRSVLWTDWTKQGKIVLKEMWYKPSFPLN